MNNLKCRLQLAKLRITHEPAYLNISVLLAAVYAIIGFCPIKLDLAWSIVFIVIGVVLVVLCFRAGWYTLTKTNVKYLKELNEIRSKYGIPTVIYNGNSNVRYVNIKAKYLK